MKKTLLIAAAALAAGVITSQAQVYSVNVVGYANVPATAGNNVCLCIPFKIWVSNGMQEIFSVNNAGVIPTLPDGSTLAIWNGAGFDAYVSDSGSPSLWDDSGNNPMNSAPALPVGQGFFLSPFGAGVTNTFAGTVAVNVGTSNSITIGAGINLLLGGLVPYGGSVTNGTTSNGGLGLNNLPDGSTLAIWNGAGFDTYVSDSGSPSLWDDSGNNPIATAPTIGVGQGFFLSPFGAPYKFTQGL